MSSKKNKPTTSTRPAQQDAESMYLQQLTFDENLRGSWIEVLFRNVRLVLLLIFAIIGFGLFSFFLLPRELNPDVVISAVNVITVLPGASPKDVESLISSKLEKAAPNLSNIDTVTSRSTEGVSVVTFQFLSNQDPDEAARMTKEEIDLLVEDLPEDATEPKVQKININDQPFLITALVGDLNRLTMSEIAENIQDKLEQTNGIRKVELNGNEEEEIVISLNPATLKTYNLSDQAITQALKSNNINFPTGSISVGDLEYTLSVSNELNTLDKIRALPVSTGNGTTLRLGEVADVYLQTKEITNFQRYRKNGQPLQNAIELSIYKADDETITAAHDKAQQVLNEELKKYPQVEVVDILDFSKEISTTFEDLQGNFASSIGLMFVVLAVFLGMRQASIAALSIPLTILNVFIIMNIMGLSLNFLSLFSLLLALGLIGDDAIVMAQSTTEYGKKFGPIETGLLVFRDFFIPIWVGTITVVWSFLPLLMASGIIGEFIKPIPLVVTATLLSSTAIATILNLPLNVILRRTTLPKRVKILIAVLAALLLLGVVSLVAGTSPVTGLAVLVYVGLLVTGLLAREQIGEWIVRRSQALGQKYPQLNKAAQWAREKNIFSNNILSLQPLVKLYRRWVEDIITHPAHRLMIYALVVVLLIISGVFMVTGLLKTEFFPKTDQDLINVSIEAPAGWSVDQTQQVLDKVETEVMQEPLVKSVQSTTGRSGNLAAGGASGKNYASLTILLEKKENRDVESPEIASRLRQKLRGITDAKVSVVEETGGPPAGADFQANIKGESLEELERISNDFQVILREIPGAINIESSLKLSPGQITVELNQQELSERGLSAQQVAGWLRTALSGNEASDTIIDTKDRDISIRLENNYQDLSMLSNMTLPSAMGSYTLSEVATLKLENSPTSIEREDGRKVVRVLANVEGLSATELFQAFQVKAKDYPMPAGYSWDVGGANEENEKSVQSIIQAMGVSFFLILVTMILQLHSFRKALMVLVVIPLALVGVFINFTLFNIPLSFPALIGVLSLFGIVVNNSLMLVEKINLNLEYGFSVKDAVVDACSSRVEAIFLSSFTAIVGLLPVTISDPLWRGLGGAIIAGLSVSGLLILLLLPAMYIEVYGRGDKK